MKTTNNQLPTGFPSFTTSLLVWPSSNFLCRKLFFPLCCSERSPLKYTGRSHQLVFWHKGMVCSCTFKISFLGNVQPSWSPFPSGLTPKRVSTGLLNSLKTAFWKSIVAVLLIPPQFCANQKTLFLLVMLRMASKYETSLLPIHKQQLQQSASLHSPPLLGTYFLHNVSSLIYCIAILYQEGIDLLEKKKKKKAYCRFLQNLLYMLHMCMYVFMYTSCFKFLFGCIIQETQKTLMKHQVIIQELHPVTDVWILTTFKPQQYCAATMNSQTKSLITPRKLAF